MGSETGIANIVIWPDLFERCRRQILGGVSITDLPAHLARLAAGGKYPSRNFR